MMGWTISFLTGALLGWLAIFSQRWLVRRLLVEPGIPVMKTLAYRYFRLIVMAVVLFMVLQTGIVSYLLFSAGFVTGRWPALYYLAARV